MRHVRQTSLYLLLLLALLGQTLYAQQQGYGGPSLLSRGGNRAGQRGRAPADITYYVALRGFADTGLTAVAVDAAGQVQKLSTTGTQIEVGLYGAKNVRKGLLGVDYRGDYRKSFGSRRSGQFNGTNQALSLDYQKRLSQRVLINLRQTGGTTNRAFGGFVAPAFSDLDSLGIPTNQVFDSRTYFSQTSLIAAVQKSARLAFAFNVDGFFVKRADPALIGNQGYRTGAQFEYRLSTRTSVGAGYNFSEYKHPRIVGGSTINTVQVMFRHRVGPNLDILLSGGANRIDSTGSQRVVLSPEISAILGRRDGVQGFRRVAYSPQVEATVQYRLQHSALRAGYTGGVNPGNGIYATSRQSILRVGYSYAGIRKIALAASAGYSRNGSVGLTLQDYTSVQGGVGITRKLTEYISFSSQIDYRSFSAGTLQGREGFALTMGFTVSPSRLPLAIW
ncbi:MAG: hypothetical protein WKF37_07260 [Bryobacteraceae bacterium]